jgi:hypothetical protein
MGATNVSSIQKYLTGLSARTGRCLRGSELTDPTVTGASRGEQGAETVFGVIYPTPFAIVVSVAEKLPGWVVAVRLVLSLATSGLMGWTPNLGGQISHTEIRADFEATAKTEIEGKQKTRRKKITNNAPVIFSRAPVEVYNRQ